MGILFVYHFIPYLELSCCKKRRKSPGQETSLRNRGCLKVLNDAKLFLNDSYSFRTNLVSFRTFRRPLFPKPFSCHGFYFLSFLTARQLYCQNYIYFVVDPMKIGILVHEILLDLNAGPVNHN